MLPDDVGPRAVPARSGVTAGRARELSGALPRGKALRPEDVPRSNNFAGCTESSSPIATRVRVWQGARAGDEYDPYPVIAERRFNALPGFGLTMGYTLLYLSLIVLLPVAALFLKASELSWTQFWGVVTTDRALATYRLTFGASAVAALANAVFGALLAWVLVRYQFPGRRLVDAMVDFPFALPTAVAGLTLANLFSGNGWLGRFLVTQLPDGTEGGIRGAYTQLGVVIALTFVGMPFAVRTLQPVLENLDREVEEAAATLGAGRWRTFASVIAPTLLPTVITGFALSFARAVGEYGSVVFISGNLPFKTEIAPYLIVMKLDEFKYLDATAIAAVLMVISFIILAVINGIEEWAGRFHR